MIKGKTCITKKHSSSIDVILTNKKRLFKNSGTIETGVSDFHKMVLTMFRVQFKKLKPIQITVSETKLDDQFPDNLFHVDGYHIFRRDRNSFGGGLMTLNLIYHLEGESTLNRLILK